MALLLLVSLTSALLYSAESLNCHMCTNDMCTNSTSIRCPSTEPICRTVTTVMQTNTSTTVTVYKNCSALSSCFTPLGLQTELSTNQGFFRQAQTQLCCITNNCNIQTLATPSLLLNGKECPGCANAADSLAGTCNATVSCAGAEDSCFNATVTVGSTSLLQLGCVSRNICTLHSLLGGFLGNVTVVTCAAPWSIRISGALLTFALMTHKLLV